MPNEENASGVGTLVDEPKQSGTGAVIGNADPAKDGSATEGRARSQSNETGEKQRPPSPPDQHRQASEPRRQAGGGAPSAKPKRLPLGAWNWVAIACVALIIGVLVHSERAILKEANGSFCDVPKQISGNKPFFLGDKTGTFSLHTHLCVALKRKIDVSDPTAKDGPVFVLFFDGQNTGLKTMGYPLDDHPDWLQLDWKIQPPDSDPNGIWTSILSNADPSTGHRQVKIGVGVDGAPTPFETLPTSASLDLYDPIMTRLGAAVLLMLGVSIFLGNKDTGLFRDGDGTIGDGKTLSAYSLAKVQTGVWILLTIGGFLFIWATTGRAKGVVNPDVFALMGIQLGTGLAAVMVDQDKKPAPSISFLRDILSSDGRSPALQRMQMFAWTLILGGIFLCSIFTKLVFPAFDTSLLALIGFVNGNYLGFKFPENKASESKPDQ